MLVDSGAACHYICRDLEPAIIQYIIGVVLLEKPFLIKTASDEVGCATAKGYNQTTSTTQPVRHHRIQGQEALLLLLFLLLHDKSKASKGAYSHVRIESPRHR